MFTKIVCAVDGSKHALRAARVASEIAALSGAELTFLTVAKKLRVNKQIRQYLELEHLGGEAQYVMDDMTDSIMSEAQAAARERGVKKVNTEIESGQPARTIVAYAKRNGIDLIVMGRRGLGDVGGMLLGSVSHKVASLADCTVTTVR